MRIFNFRKFLPKSLLARTVMITTAPLLLTQLIAGYVFLDRHWDSVTRQLADALAGDIVMVVRQIEESRRDHIDAELVRCVQVDLKISVAHSSEKILENEENIDHRYKNKTIISEYLDRNFWKNFLIDALKNRINNKFHIKITRNYIIIKILTRMGVVSFETSRRRVFEKTTSIFFMWSFGGMILFLTIALAFMRNQIRPILNLALAAEDFGRGRDVENFKPQGAVEVRKAAIAFIKMKNRIQKQIDQRTAMLSGVSHDLRTPLTRIRLQLAMMPQAREVQMLEQDVKDMEGMIENYLNYIRLGESEPFDKIDVNELVQGALHKLPVSHNIHCSLGPPCVLALQKGAMLRCLSNLLINGQKYGKQVWLQTKVKPDQLILIIEDDGPGIPHNLRKEVFKPFRRLDEARNLDIPGSGLGLAIARDILKNHEGSISLEQSRRGGLKVIITLPK